MTPCFADTLYYIALLNRSDAYHDAAVTLAKKLTRPTVTSMWVLTEVADGLSPPPSRALAAAFIDDLRTDLQVTVVDFDPDLFEMGWKLYIRRKDKHWSLTDCISFVIMERHHLRDALTADHHFEQAGFRILLKN